MFTRSYCALGYRCNNNCLICIVDAYANRHKNMTTKEIIKLFDGFKHEKYLNEVEFSGGEPTIRKDFLYLLSYLSKKYPYLFISILTNGRRFSNQVFTREVSKHNIGKIIIVFHHYKEEIHDEQTQAKNSFKETYLGVKNLCEFRVPVTIKIIVTKLNYKAMPQIVEFVAKNFPLIKNMSINGLDLRARAEQFKNRVAVSFTDYIHYVQKAIDTANKYDINMVIYSIPLCVLDEPYRKYTGAQPDTVSIYQSPIGRINNKTEDHGYIKKCNDCAINKKCYGTWFSYYDVFGINELKVQKQKQNGLFFININGSCNNNCLFCCEFGSRPEKDISFEKLKQKIDVLNIKKKDAIILSGGEPTLCEYILPLIKFLKPKCANIEMFTNGIKLSDITFCRELKKEGVEKYSIPLHAPTANLHDKISLTKTSFEKTTQGIKNIMNCGCREITIKILMHQINYLYLKKIVEFAHKNFKNNFNILFSFTSMSGNAIDNQKILSIKASKVTPYLDDAIKFCKSKSIFFSIDKFPICLLENKESIKGTKESMYIDEKEKGSFNKSAICKTCAFYKTKCNGVWSGYIQEYGISEFTPK